MLFVNSGMVQFKSMFEGRVPPSGHPLSGLKRATNSQKCIRAGGKHNDLDDVGKDNYHHTFFEMLGSWSFGDYFKTEAIDQAWVLLTQEYGLKPEQLYATYFGGDETLGIPPDFEARDLWLRYLPATNVLPGNMEDNFWEMGDVGPCGPCSELHYDRIGGGRNAAVLVNQDDPDVLEIWNLVFMQYVREKSRDGTSTTLESLREKHIDTGMGLERLASILQEQTSNYKIDAFQTILDDIYELRCLRHEARTEDSTGVAPLPYQDGVGPLDDPNGVDAAYRVVADHARTLVFAIGDQVQPSNAGRGYVLRRILRRGVLYGERTLGLGSAFFSKLVPVVVATYGDAYPELIREQERIVSLIQKEEMLFHETWDSGQKDFEKLTSNMTQKGLTQVSGVDAARLHQERGFPIDLTRLLAEERGMTVDESGFEQAQAEHVAMSKKNVLENTGGGGRGGGGGGGGLDFGGIESATRDFRTATSWTGTQTMDPGSALSGTTSVLAVSCNSKGKGLVLVEELVREDVGCAIAVALSSTGYYVESGGQVDDTGVVVVQCGGGRRTARIQVVGMQDVGGVLWHLGVLQHVSEGPVQCQASTALWQVNQAKRTQINVNHTATHLLNAALRQVVVGGGGGATVEQPETLDENCDQRGSLVNEDRIRFDFALSRGLTMVEVGAIEDRVNAMIHSDEEVHIGTLPLNTALNDVPGLRAVFGESYPDPVRVVSVGAPIQELCGATSSTPSVSLSVELCGGTHVERTSTVASFVVCEERGVAKGVRRVSCLTGQAANKAGQDAVQLVERVHLAEENLFDNEQELRRVASDIDENASTLPYTIKLMLRERIETNLKSIGKEKKRIDKQAEEMLQHELKVGLEQEAVVVVVTDQGGRVQPKKMRKMMTKLLKKSKTTKEMFVLVKQDNGGGMCYAACGKNSGLNAGDWVEAVTEKCGGKGGGRNDFAQASGVNVDDAENIARSYYEGR